MNAIERIKKTLNHEESDRVPSYEIVIDNYDVYNHFGEEYIYEGLVKSVADAYELMKGDTDFHPSKPQQQIQIMTFSS